MRVRGGAVTRGYACLSAEGSGHAGHPACAHMLRAARCSQAGGVEAMAAEATAAAALAAQT